MRKSTLRTALAALCLCLGFTASAQKQHPAAPPGHRCGTMDMLNKIIREDPSIVNRWREEGQRQYQAYLQRKQLGEGQRVVAGEIHIPVVFHLVGSSTVLNVIRDRDIYDQLEILNRDFAGHKAEFYKAHGVFSADFVDKVGNIPVKFVLARRTPAGTATNGIERLVTTKTFTQTTINELKSTTLGGLSPWDVTKYLNIWCAIFSDNLLGIATFPFTNSATIGPQGVAIHLATLGANPCRGYYSPLYSEGATLSHEVGHFLYLWHTFGDNTACNNLDFRIQTGWPLTPAASLDDTPNEKADETTMYGNVSGIYTDGCSTNPPGMMYMNYMNYFDDRSLFMFTKGQKERVIATMDMYRAALRDSDADLPPAATTDAYLVSVSPWGNCAERSPILPNTPLKARIRNYGTTDLTSVTVNYAIDGGSLVSTAYPVTVTAGKDTTLEVGSISGVRGNHSILVYLTAPNGGTDAYLHNDTLTTQVNIRDNYLTPPFTENFGGLFPPRLTTVNDLWYVNNPTGSNSWFLSDANYTYIGGVVSRNYTYNEPGQFDELITPPIDYTGFDSSILHFKVAYSRYEDAAYSWDGLEVLASNNGGQSWFLVYKKTGANLQTKAAATTSAFDPGTTASLWRTESVNLTPYITNGEKVILKFRNVNAYGQNIFLDDIGVTAAVLATRDASVTAIKSVPSILCNDFDIQPVVTIANLAKDALTTLKVSYRIDNNAPVTINWTGNLAKGSTADVALGNIANIPAGAHLLTVYTADPNGGADQNKHNDTARFNFTIFTPVNAPITQGFEAGTFPPDGWGLKSSGSTNTWERTTLSATEKTAAAWVHNFKSTAGQTDQLYSPIVKLTAADSVYIHFDLAHATYVRPGSTALPMDTLEILLSTDCGVTFTSVYKKWGADLQTIGDPNRAPEYDRDTDPIGFVPTSQFWRKEFIDITRAVAGKTEVQVIFKNTSNAGNNTFLDNINIRTVVLPARLKSEGYLVYPNPSTTSVEVRHLLPPVTLKGVVLINSSGQVVHQQAYNGNAANSIRIDLNRFPQGIYTLRMIYADKVVTERLVKRPY